MAFEQYLISRQQACYKSPLSYEKAKPSPECTPDYYTQLFRKRWDALKVNPCQTRSLERADACDLLDRKDEKGSSYYEKSQGLVEVCIPVPQKKDTLYNTEHSFPKSHNAVDDCCKSINTYKVVPNPEPPNNPYECWPREKLPPLDDLTTHRQFFTKKPVPPKPCRPIKHWYPSDCRMEGATTYRVDYPHKKRIPNGPVPAALTDNGIWSMEQFSPEPLDEETENTAQFPPKCYVRRPKIPPRPHLTFSQDPFAKSSETCSQFGPKEGRYPRTPRWLCYEPEWVKPCPPLEDCTTYKHFYQPYPLSIKWDEKKNDFLKMEVVSPKAIPFPTMHNMWYTCHDPKIDFKSKVEIRDNEPWPYAVRCPIKYQDNLQTDPCAPLRDETTHKADFTAKKRCVKVENFAPCKGYTPPIQPINDNTTHKCAFRAYTKDEYDNAILSPGNFKGKYFGPFKCPPKVDKCLPRFPAPYGHPLKPYTSPCPCGPYDDRSSYHHDFKFRSKEMIEFLEEEMCAVPDLKKGDSLSRNDFVDQKGQKAERMEPPISKGHRCVNPSSYRDLDTLYRLQYEDFWKKVQKPKLGFYLAKRYDPKAVQKRQEKEAEEREAGGYEIITTPEGTTVEDVLNFLERDKVCCDKQEPARKIR